MKEADPSNRPNRPHISSDTQLSKSAGPEKPRDKINRVPPNLLGATRSNLPKFLFPKPLGCLSNRPARSPSVRRRPVGEGVSKQTKQKAQAVS
ncbi:hypothetical protein, partial [Meridianimarinicoccus aquatilis]|uniref:hypothetical protein n=1 Tax=Meridianimarinicoccus aquatilis TaxID=2552766 RepID=UPI001AA03511